MQLSWLEDIVGGVGSFRRLPMQVSPGAFDAEGAQVGGFGFFERMFDEAVDAATARAAAQAGAEFGKVGGFAVCDDFNIAFFRVAHPAAKVEFAGFAVNEPAEADTLHPALNEKVKNHG